MGYRVSGYMCVWEEWDVCFWGYLYVSITCNWINLEYVYIAAFDYKSWQRTWHTFGTDDIYTKMAFDLRYLQITRYVYLNFNLLTFLPFNGLNGFRIGNKQISLFSFLLLQFMATKNRCWLSGARPQNFTEIIVKTN